MRGADLLVHALARRGVRTIFSLSGNQIMPVYDACLDAGVRIVHVRQEAAAVFMADAFAQVRGTIGVALVTAGPGACNAISALFAAREAESPVLLLAGDSPVGEDGRGAFQELDQSAMARPVTKRTERVTRAVRVAAAIDESIDCALAARRGPVHLALPFDLLAQESGIAALEPPSPGPVRKPADRASLERLARALTEAARPIVVAGPTQCRAGVQAAWEAWSAATGVPVIFMQSARGLRDPGNGTAVACIARADLVVLAGKRLDYSLGFGERTIGPDARVIAIDADPAMLDRAVKLLGPLLVARIEADPDALLAIPAATLAPGRAEWLESIARARADRTLANPPPEHTARPDSLGLCRALQERIARARDPLLVCEGGEIGQWAQAFCDAPVRIVNGMSGAIGGGLPYAIGAKIATPGADVFLVSGDGAAGFHFAEFETAARERAGLVAVIGNDARWNAEHLIQQRSFGPERRIGCELSPATRYADAAAAFGAFGRRVERAADLGAALDAALAASRAGRPACVDVAMEGWAAPVFGAAGAYTGH